MEKGPAAGGGGGGGGGGGASYYAVMHEASGEGCSVARSQRKTVTNGVVTVLVPIPCNTQPGYLLVRDRARTYLEYRWYWRSRYARMLRAIRAMAIQIERRIACI